MRDFWNGSWVCSAAVLWYLTKYCVLLFVLLTYRHYTVLKHCPLLEKAVVTLTIPFNMNMNETYDLCEI